MITKRLSSVEWKTFLGFGIALAILLTLGNITLKFLIQTKSDDQWVEHTHYVIEHLQVCMLAEREIETAARAYVLTGEDPYLTIYKSGIANLDQSTQMLQRLTVDNPANQDRIKHRLRPLIDERLAQSWNVIQVRQKAGQQPAIAILFTHDVLNLVVEIRQVINEMQTEERILLNIRIQRHNASSQKLRLSILLGSASAVLFVIIASFLIHRDWAARQHMEEELRTNEARLKAQTEELQTINKELESFSYTVSHDLRAPLRGIEGFSQLIRENYKSRLDAEGQGYFERVCAAAKRMGTLIDEILNLSRITRSPLTVGDVDLAVMAADIAKDLEQAEPERKIKWTIPQSLRVRGDAALLRIGLLNLISNAWKFTGKRSEAHIEIGKTTRSQETVYFVRDDGAGFDMTYQNKLFQAFQRLHTTTEFPGTGIGLATVQRVIQRHGGRIWAEGQVDAGATFYFTL